MRIVLLSIVTLLGVGLRVCGSDPPPPPPPPATVAAEIEADLDVEPEHGGTIVLAGEHVVEVVPHASGQVFAYVHGDAPDPEDVELTVGVHVRGSARPRPVVLHFNPEEERYEAHVKGVVVAGGTDVVLEVDGHPYRGHVDAYVVGPRIDVEIHPVEVYMDGHEHGKWKRHKKHKKHKKHEKHRHHHDHGHVGVHGEVHVDLPRPPPPPSVRVEGSARVGVH